MSQLFESGEVIKTSQAIDYFENGFLRAVFKAMSGKDVLDNVAKNEIPTKRQELVTGAINNLTAVANKAIFDNPLDTMRIIEKAKYTLGICVGKISERLESIEPETVNEIAGYASTVEFKINGEREAIAYAKVFDDAYERSTKSAISVVDSMVSSIPRFENQEQGREFVIGLLLGQSEHSPEIIKSGNSDYELGQYITKVVLPLRQGTRHIAPRCLH